MEFKTKSYCGGQVPPFSFPVLCKGNNSGKPLEQPCPNCFIVICNNHDDMVLLKQLSWGLWKGKVFLHWLTGSVIPFITIRTYNQVIQSALPKIETQPKKVLEAVFTMQQLEEFQNLKLQQARTARELQVAIFHKFLM